MERFRHILSACASLTTRRNNRVGTGFAFPENRRQPAPDSDSSARLSPVGTAFLILQSLQIQLSHPPESASAVPRQMAVLAAGGY